MVLSIGRHGNRVWLVCDSIDGYRICHNCAQDSTHFRKASAQRCEIIYFKFESAEILFTIFG